jgi:Uri superfamily endonuclease
LVLTCPREVTIEVGRLGDVTVPAGVVVYVGSAFGPGGLGARLRRHVVGSGPLRWHVDRLRGVATPVGAFVACGDRVLEHVWARAFRTRPGAGLVAPHFGASDCDCAAHLFSMRRAPTARWLRRAAGGVRVHWLEAARMLASDGSSRRDSMAT